MTMFSKYFNSCLIFIGHNYTNNRNYLHLLVRSLKQKVYRQYMRD